MFRPEGRDAAAISCHHRNRHQIWEMGDEQLFRRIAHLRRIIHHERLGVDMFQNMGGRNVAHVKGRVLAHQHNIGIAAKVQFHLRPEGEVVAIFSPERDGARPGSDAPAAQRQIPHMVMPELMAPRLRFQHQGKGGIAINIDGLYRVHLDRNA